MTSEPALRYRFGPFELRPSESVLLRAGEPVVLQPKTFEALTFFVERAGQLVSKEEIYARLWPDTFVNEEALTQVIRKLRLALEDDAKEPRFLQTVLKRGYRFLPTVEMLAGEPRAPRPASRPRSGELETVVAASPRRGVGRRWIVVAAALLTVAGAASWSYRAARRAEEPPSRAARWHRTRLTSTPEREQEAVFSPDGRSYAYAAYDAESAQFDLFLASFAGGQRVRLTRTSSTEAYPQFSPDGDAIAFTRLEREGKSSVMAMSPLGGNERVLVADGRWGVWSPDGKSLAYVRRAGDGDRLMRRELATGVEIDVARHGLIGSPAWSPDGERLAFTDQRAVWVVDAGGGAPNQVGESAEALRSIAWEAGGQSILCDASWNGVATGIWRLPLDGGPPEPVAGAGNSFHPAISRDGRRVLVAEEHKIRQLWRLDAAGGQPTPLSASTSVECLESDPHGGSIVYGDWSPQPGEASLGLLDLETSQTRPLAQGTCGAMSPDGHEVAYLGAAPNEEGVWVVDVERGAKRRLVERAAPHGFVEVNLYRRPAWSPDGRRIAYPEVDPEPGLMVVDAQGGPTRRLAKGSFGPPSWSPDGRWIAALGRTDREGGLHLVAADGSEVRPMGPSWGYARAAPLWETDSRSLRVLTDEARHPTLLQFDLDGHEIAPAMPLGRVLDPAFWGIFDLTRLPDGSLVYLLERYEGDLYLLEAEP